jgi:N-methylhydantoinase B
MASEAYAAARFFGRHENGAPSILVFMDTVTGAGGGAQTPDDGQDMYGNCTMAGAGVPDVEVHEAAGPVVFLWRRVAANSGGPGQRRGGQGLDEAYVLHGIHPFAGSATGACAEFPPPGAGGGFPPSTRALYPIRATPPWSGRAPHDEAELGGLAEAIPTSIGRLVLEPGDAVRAVGGGGSGLGDPLLRAPELVARDVRDGYVTVAHAVEAYGVVVAADGTPDAAATADLRGAARRARIGATPEREAVAPEVPGLSVTLDDRAWACASCDGELAAADEDWRDGAVRDEAPVASLYAQLGMRVRERIASPGVLVVRYYCPACAGCLATDVVSDRAQAAPPILAAATAVV